MWYEAARIAGLLRPKRRGRGVPPQVAPDSPRGISVVIPSRNGKELLAAQLPGIARELDAGEILVVDNGSDDGTAKWLASQWPRIRVEVETAPLSFARAVNRGIAAARYSHICLLNNDMILEPGFFAALARAFEQVPNLFCATAQIHFPPGVRREETGKAVMAQSDPLDFPLRCDDPLPGEDLTWVLYGSGGCSLFDAARLRALGCVDEAYVPAYVEDLDLGYRAWQMGWPSVYVAGAAVEHRHRATTSRYYSQAELDRVLEVNYLRFLVRAVADRALFQRLWEQALGRLKAKNDAALHDAWRIAFEGGPHIEPAIGEAALLAVTDGSIAVFPGQGTGRVLLAARERLAPPAPEDLADYEAVVVVRGKEAAVHFQTAAQLAAQRWPGATLLAVEWPGGSVHPLRTT